jgi:hypothetical protein
LCEGRHSQSLITQHSRTNTTPPQATTKLRDSIAKAKIAEQTQRKMMDSIIAANSGAAVASRPVAKNEVLANLDALLLSTMTYLDGMSRAPRRPATP